MRSDSAEVLQLDAPLAGSDRFHGELHAHRVHERLTHPHEMGLMKWLV